MAGRQFTTPVIAESQRLQLLAHIIDVFVGPFSRCHMMLDRRIFSRQAERIPAHRLHHILAQHALIAADHITDGVISDMPHMQLATGIWKHRQAIVLLLIRLLADNKSLLLIPQLLSIRFTGFRVVMLIHD